jgi:hypothetical protein
MSKIFIATFATLSILLMPLHGYATPGGGQAPGDQAQENANDNASFKRDQQDIDKKDKEKNKDKSDKADKPEKSEKQKD